MTLTAPQLMLTAAPSKQGRRGVTAREATHCGFCARDIAVGEVVVPLSDLRPSFTDQPSLVVDAWAMCSDCAQLSDKRYMSEFACSVVTETDVVAFRKNVHIAYFVYNPPRGPFLALVGTKSSQHIVWKARVNYNADLFFLCLEGSNYIVRRKLLLRAAQASRDQFAEIESRRALCKTRAGKGEIGYPHHLLRCNFKVAFHGEIAYSASAVNRALIQSLSPGELWLLPRIQGQDPAKLEAPPSLLTSKDIKAHA